MNEIQSTFLSKISLSIVPFLTALSVVQALIATTTLSVYRWITMLNTSPGVPVIMLISML